MTIQTYNTILKEGTAIYEEKKSKFIGLATPACCEEEAMVKLSAHKKLHREANHNTYAYRFLEKNLERQSDDGEPSGTAGLPILTVLKGAHVVDILLIVTRYFGGTLLGTGGLVRAYGHAAKGALQEAGVAEMILFSRIQLEVSYPFSEKLAHHILKTIRIEDIQYTDKVTYTVLVEKGKAEDFQKNIIQSTEGTAKIQLVNELFQPVR